MFCPDCGAPATKMTMDHSLIIPYKMNEYGEVTHTEMDQEDMMQQAAENTLNAQRLFCGECGGYFSLRLQEDGSTTFSEDLSKLEGF